MERTLQKAIVAYLVKEYSKHKEYLGRTVLQKLSYFSLSKGVPLDLEFEIYHYGTFAQELYWIMDELIFEGVVRDSSKDPSVSKYQPTEQMDSFLSQFGNDLQPWREDLDVVARVFKNLTPAHMELYSSTHYIFNVLKRGLDEPSREEVVTVVYEIKQGKFPRETCECAFDVLKKHGLLQWAAK